MLRLSGRQTTVTFITLVLAATLAACAGAATPAGSQATGTPGAGNPLAGTKWMLTSLRGQPLLAGTHISLAIEDERLSGFAGCNNYGGGPDGDGYVATDERSLSFPVFEVTVQLCLTPEGVMEQEQAYIEALLSAATYRLNDGRLEFLDAAGETVLVYGRDGAGAALPDDCIPVTSQSPGQIPACIVEKADQFVMSRVGRAHFGEHCSYDPVHSEYNEADPSCIQDPSNCAEYLQKPYYLMVYSCRVPEAPDGEISAEFAVDATGNLITEREVFGVPDCAREPRECVFISEASALSAAREADLEAGLGEWETSFHWYAGELNTYVWTVSNTLQADTLTGQSSGRTLVIDANSGKILEVLGWQRIP